MVKQSILHRMLIDEMKEFEVQGIKPTVVAMTHSVFHHMQKWEDINKYYTPAEEAEDHISRYCGIPFTLILGNTEDDLYVSHRARYGQVKLAHENYLW